ncbi:MAG: hypothetical protein Q9195_002815 [Heterodermia aff. obscurata]
MEHILPMSKMTVCLTEPEAKALNAPPRSPPLSVLSAANGPIREESLVGKSLLWETIYMSTSNWHTTSRMKFTAAGSAAVGYRPYKCPECSEGFAAAAVRDEHIANIHMKKKIFACDLCSHQCTSATNLKRHKDEKHRSERFQCEYCNKYGKRTLFPRGPNLARHFRKCKYVLAEFPDAGGAPEGKLSDDWFPPGYKRGHHGMNKAKITPPNYLPFSESILSISLLNAHSNPRADLRAPKQRHYNGSTHED